MLNTILYVQQNINRYYNMYTIIYSIYLHYIHIRCPEWLNHNQHRAEPIRVIDLKF